MTSTQPLIRTASPNDMPALVNLVEQYWSFEDMAGFDARRIESLLHAALFAEGRARCWLAEQAGEIGGYLLAVPVFSLEHGGMMAEIDEFFVIPAFRRARRRRRAFAERGNCSTGEWREAAAAAARIGKYACAGLLYRAWLRSRARASSCGTRRCRRPVGDAPGSAGRGR